MIVRYVLPFSTPWTKGRFSVPLKLTCQAFRPTHLRTISGGPDLVRITSVRINGREQLTDPVDAYDYDMDVATKLVDDFYDEIKRKYGLKTDEEIDDFLDDREWSAPDPGSFLGASVARGETIVVEGEILADLPRSMAAKGKTHFGVLLTGAAAVETEGEHAA